MNTGDELGSDNPEYVSTKIAREVAAKKGVDPTFLTPRLGEVIDPDAIDALFGRDGMEGRLEFTYCGHRVIVQGDNGVSVSVRRQPGPGDVNASAGATSDVD